jgi:hypothetical protein
VEVVHKVKGAPTEPKANVPAGAQAQTPIAIPLELAFATLAQCPIAIELQESNTLIPEREPMNV